MTIYEIDGNRFSTLEEFYDEITSVLGLSLWGHNLDAFNDILRGGFGTPDGGFVLRWKNHHVSEQRLGYPVRQLKSRLDHCHPTARLRVTQQLERARAGQGPSVFDWLVEIIRDHGPGGDQEEDKVELLLE